MARKVTRSTRIWVGVGAAVVVGAGAAGHAEEAARPTSFQEGQPALPFKLAQATTPGHQHAPTANEREIKPEGAKPDASAAGEGEGAAGSLDPRVRFYRDIGLIRGHLLVGDELVKEGRWDDAMPHYLHPVEEIYANIAATLKRQDIRPFQSQLKALAQTVQARNPDAYALAWKTVDQRLTEAEQKIRQFAASWPQFTMQTAMALLATAGGEYENAIEDGRIAKPVEYQDSRGFVFRADRLLAALPADLDKGRSESLAKTRGGLAELQKSWPGAMPPGAPGKDHAALMAGMAQIEVSAGPILKP